MNCHAYESTIGDYIEGTLAPAAAHEVGLHLASCDACRRLTDDLRAIRSAARMLDRHEPPPRTWHRIAAAVETERSVSAFAWPGWRQLTVAAALLLLLIAGWSVWRAPEPPAPETASRTTAAAASDFDVQSTEANYQSAIAGLEQITTAGGNELDPQTAEVLRANLTAIDTAIGESRAALETEPTSDVAQERLFAALDTKLALLQDTVALINALRQGDANDTSSLTPGLNQ